MAENILIGTEEAQVSGLPFPSLVHDLTYYKKNFEDPDYVLRRYIDRAFISFSYGDKNIEDFKLISVFNSSRMERNAYANFSDIIQELEVLDGQRYWDSHYDANTLDFVLATDGMTEEDLDNFKSWFTPGVERELVVAEHPNRAIKARISEVPRLMLVPFPQEIEVTLGGKKRTITTSLYKGEINLSFVMDNPFWYAKTDIFYYKGVDDVRDYSLWFELKDNSIPIYTNDDDVFKVAYEDRIPFLSMLTAHQMSTGSDIIFNMSNKTRVSDEDTLNLEYATIWDGPEGQEDGLVGPLAVRNDSNADVVFPSDSYLYFFYAGTAPSKPKISFTLTPSLNINILTNITYGYKFSYLGKEYLEEGYETAVTALMAALNIINELRIPYASRPAMSDIIYKTEKQSYDTCMINVPDNSYNNSIEINYNKIIFEGVNKKEFRFTTPSVWTGVNLAISIMKEMDGRPLSEVREAIIKGVGHFAPRAYAINTACAGDGTEKLVITDTPDSEGAITKMLSFLKDDDGNLMPAKFSFNFETGEMKGIFSYRKGVYAMGYRASNSWSVQFETTEFNEEELKEEIIIEVQEYNIVTKLEKTEEEARKRIIKEWAKSLEGKNNARMIYPTEIIINQEEGIISSIEMIEENVGDMVKTTDLTIEERNSLDKNGYIANWTEEHPEYSYRVYHDVPDDNLKNFFMSYKHNYL